MGIVLFLLTSILIMLLAGGIGFTAYVLFKKAFVAIGLMFSLIIGIAIPYSFGAPELFLGSLFGVIFYYLLILRDKNRHQNS